MFREKSHGSDLSLEIVSLTREGLFKETARGLAFMTGVYFGVQEGQEERVIFRGESDEELLVLLLEEILYRQSLDGMLRLPLFLCRKEESLEAAFALFTPFISGPQLFVKGVTWHGLSFISKGAFWQASVIFDL